MCNRLTHGKGSLVQIQRAFEHHRQNIRRTAGTGQAGPHHFCQTVTVVFMQLLNSCVQACEGFAM